MRALTLILASTAAFAAAFGGIASAQIIVSRPGEQVVHRESRYGYCWVDVGDVSYISGTVFLPRDDIRAVFLAAYEAYAKANIGSVRDTFCRDDLGYPGAAEEDINRWITNNRHVSYVRNGWTGGFPTQGAQAGKHRPAAKPVAKASIPKPASTPAPLPVAKGPTPNQLKYQREMAEFQQRLAEIDRVKAATQAKFAADKAAAQQVIAQHRQDMDLNRQQVAAAERAKRQYEAELAAHQAQVAQMRSKQERDRLVDWPEAVTVCELNGQDPQSKLGNWRCEGPLQFTYAKLGNGGQIGAKAMVSLSEACGGKIESVRDLAMVGGYRVFGCSFGLHPMSEQQRAKDKAIKFGLAYVPGRTTYRCPKSVSFCRTH